LSVFDIKLHDSETVSLQLSGSNHLVFMKNCKIVSLHKSYSGGQKSSLL
jgi:hypothetical protein